MYVNVAQNFRRSNRTECICKVPRSYFGRSNEMERPYRPCSSIGSMGIGMIKYGKEVLPSKFVENAIFRDNRTSFDYSVWSSCGLIACKILDKLQIRAAQIELLSKAYVLTLAKYFRFRIELLVYKYNKRKTVEPKWRAFLRFRNTHVRIVKLP